MNYKIREMLPCEYHLLEDFLYEAIFKKDESIVVPRDIIYKPELQVYIEEFGQRKDYYCFAAWLRYGHCVNGTNVIPLKRRGLSGKVRVCILKRVHTLL